MIGIVNCHIGNIGSLLNAFSYLGEQAEVIHDPAQLDVCRAIVLPGVGAFDAAMASVERTGFNSSIKCYAASGRPVMGICLGMQILCNGSEEGKRPGLGLINGQVMNLRNLGCRGKIPHVGFNSIEHVDGGSPFLLSAASRDFYFIHSFALQSTAESMAIAYVEYEGAKFIAALQHENIFATQFHPEKSGEAGLALMRQFLSC